MLRRDAGKFVSICDGFRTRNFFRLGRGFLPLLAVMLLAAPQLAFAQDSLAVTVNPRTLDINEVAPGNSGTYQVQLDAEPSEAVEITVVGGTGVVTVNLDTLTLDNSNWQDGIEVTVTAVEDANAVNETVTLTHTGMVGDEEVSLKNVSVTVMVTDSNMRSVAISTRLVEIDEAASGGYTVVLGTQPTATVTVDVDGASGEITVSPSRLFFTPGNYNAEQTVTVYAAEDFDAEDDSATLRHIVQGGDYTGVSATYTPPGGDPEPGTVSVTVDDNDARGVTVSAGSLNIAAGATATYTVMLDTQPTRTVSISVAEDPNSENSGVRVSPSRLSFSTSSWNRPQTVTVRADSDATGPATVQHAIETTSSSRDERYDGATINNPNVTVTISDAQPGIRLSTASLNVDEGASRKYTVRLASAPTGDVEVTLGLPAGSDLTLSDPLREIQSLDFTEDDWNTAQEVTVTAAEDEDAVQDTVMVTHTFNGATTTNSTLRVTIRENDTRGVTVRPTLLDVTEGASGTYTVVLDSQPTDNVTVTISGASGDVTLDRSQLTFTTANWFLVQEVVVSAADDADGEPDAVVTLRHTVRGGDYDRQRVDNVTVAIREDETRGIIVDTTPDTMDLTNILMIAEGGNGPYTVKLGAEPTGIVTVMVRGASGDVTVNPSRLVFTTSNWNDPQTVEVKVGQDADGEDDAAVTLRHEASGGGYNDVTGGMVTVTTTDNDPKGVTVTPRALTVTEGSAASAYAVVLKTEPTGTVTITLDGLEDAREQSLEVSPTSLTFTQRNWNIPQDVTVRAAEDDDGTAAPVTLMHTVNGGGYAGVMALDVTVTIRDNDTAGLTVTPDRLEITQGSSRTYTVTLNTKPTGNVTVAISPASSGGVTASPDELMFTPDNWFTARTVSVHVALNATVTAPILTNSATSSDTTYNGASVPVIVVVFDSDEPGVAVNPTELSITEGGSDSYTVVLTTAPTATVYVQVSGAAGDVTVSPTRPLTFSTSNWNREQTVTVRLLEDEDAVRDAAVTLTHTVTGADEYEDADPNTDGEQPPTISPVKVTLSENDTRGVTVMPTSLTIAAGVSGTYRVRLNSEPTDAVTITVNSPRDDVTVSGSPLVFTTRNWNAEQTVTVMVSEDAGSDEVQSVALNHTVTGGDYAGVGVSDVTVTIPVEGTPSAPRGLSATGGDQSVTLSWSTPASDGGSTIVRYQYRYQQSGSGFTEWANVPGGASATSYTVSDLENGTSYTFAVRAVNGVGGGESATDSATLAESAPGAPARLTATGGDESVTLTWNEPADGGSQILRYQYRYAASGDTWGEWMTVDGGGEREKGFRR